MTIWTKLAALAEIETERLVLRPFTYADCQSFYKVVSNSDNLAFIFPVQTTEQEARDLMVAMFMKEPLGKWAITDKKSKVFLGAISFEKLDERTRQAELGYFIQKEAWGQGLATEAVKSLSFLALHQLGLTNISIIAHLENRASQRVAEKAGFTLLRQFKGSDRYRHKMRTYRHYHLTKTILQELEREIHDHH